MRIKCMWCGKPVSTEVPDGTMICASVECPECVEERYPDPDRPEIFIDRKTVEELKRVNREEMKATLSVDKPAPGE